MENDEEMKVYVVICRTSVEYEGSSEEILFITSDERKARRYVEEHPKTYSFGGDTEYYYDTHNVED